MTKAAPAQQHMHVIDLMRGLAAIIVILWHYQHFFIIEPGGSFAPALRLVQPFYGLLWPFYEYGLYAVQFFWLLSGLVFCAVYVPKAVSTFEFVANRFSRLYPLHFVTLILVAAMQTMSVALLGRQQLYLDNDLYHFVLQLFFASNWGLQNGFSFNGPIWSVSIEVLIYGLFWVTLPFMFRLGIVGPLALAVACYIGAFIIELPGTSILECAAYFFAGAALYLGYRKVQHPLAIAVIGTMFIVMAGFSFALLGDHRRELSIPLLIVGLVWLGCACEAANWGQFAGRAKWIGDNTYGSYLWHIPIQIAVVIALDWFGVARNIALNWWFLAIFVVTVNVVARLSFLYIEKPQRSYWRNALRRLQDRAREWRAHGSLSHF